MFLVFFLLPELENLSFLKYSMDRIPTTTRYTSLTLVVLVYNTLSVGPY